jgi:hypothetical protein
MRESKKETKSVKTFVEHHNTKGLKKSAVADQLKPASQGNALIRLRGIDKNGDKLTGNNMDFNVRVPVTKTGTSPLSIAKSLFKDFEKLVKKGVVTVGEQPIKGKNPKKD